MKHDWKKHERELYGVKDKPQIITIPSQRYIMIQGSGNPNDDDFSERVAVLYSLAYPIKMRFKAMCSNNEEWRIRYNYNDYAIYPLEGVWTTTNMSNLLDKNSYQYTIMIRQPSCITQDMFDDTYEFVKKKKPHPLLDEIEFDAVEDRKSIQMLHVGSYDNEQASFAKMDLYAKNNGLERVGNAHREIYLKDARKTKPENLMTILRYQVK